MIDLTKYKNDWRAKWVQPGMVVVSVGGKAYEIKNGALPANVECVGGGGWDANGVLRWVGLDFDVGHGNAYPDRESAIEAARTVRERVGGAAEIRLSKSGNGVHVRIAIAGKITNGRAVAGSIAWWLKHELNLKCDNAVLGRQNLWFWAKTTAQYSFQIVLDCEGEWTPPAEALNFNRHTVTQAAPTPAIVLPTGNQIAERARKYIAKIPPAISGADGHGQTFRTACTLIIGFGLSIADARPLLAEWNQSCQPPWTERELEHKLNEAAKQPGERGELLRDPNAKTAYPAQKHLFRAVAPAAPAVQGVAARLSAQFEEVIAGRRFAAQWPWHYTYSLTKGLMPGFVTVICAPKGSSKSFMMMQAARFWWTEGYKPAVLMLEEDQEFHMCRALAQETGNSEITDPDWAREHPAEVRKLMKDNAAFLDGFGECVYAPIEDMSSKSILMWMKSKAESGSRIIVIDPITARTPSRQPWVDDHEFMMGSKAIATANGCSLVFVTHPSKGFAKNQSLGLWGDDDVSGGKEIQNFCQNLFWLEYMPESEIESVMTPMGISEVSVNRKLQLRKTRSKDGQGRQIAFFFDGGTLKFFERGLMQ